MVPTRNDQFRQIISLYKKCSLDASLIKMEIRVGERSRLLIALVVQVEYLSE